MQYVCNVWSNVLVVERM